MRSPAKKENSDSDWLQTEILLNMILISSVHVSTHTRHQYITRLIPRSVEFSQPAPEKSTRKHWWISEKTIIYFP